VILYGNRRPLAVRRGSINSYRGPLTFFNCGACYCEYIWYFSVSLLLQCSYFSAPPRINLTTTTMRDPQVIAGATTTLQCHVTGVPQPDIQWLNQGRPVEDLDHPGSDSSRLRVSAGGRQLEIRDSELSDAGRYTCIAKNDAGIVDRDFDLQVLGIQTLTFSLCVLYLL